jgi:enediyne biosynthesis protein E4
MRKPKCSRRQSSGPEYFDGDGIEDLFISQNFFSAIPETAAQEAISRDDSGRGLWLRGSGNGTFTATDGSITGIKVYGEQRGAALADFNHDGRVDVAVTQNNGATRLFMNEGGKRGLRVTLHGVSGNPDAIGAQMRVRYSGGGLGPCRCITAGTGYWSQDGTTQVLGCAKDPIGLWIRWPGGREESVPLEKDVWDVNVVFKDGSK